MTGLHTRLRTTAACLAMAVALSACQSGGSGGGGQWTTPETVGTIGGALGGALIGSRFGGGAGKVATIGIGTVLGALAGRAIAQSLSSDDQTRAATAEEQALSRNQAITWNNPQSGNRGTIQPTGTYRGSGGQTCREYRHTVYVGGQAETATGTACQQADGTWRLAS